MTPTPSSYALTTPYGRKTGTGFVRVEREALDLARVMIQLGDANLELHLSGQHVTELIAQLRLVQLDAEQLLELADGVAS